MTHHESHDPPKFNVDRVGFASSLVGLIGLLVCVGCLFVPDLRKGMLQSYLFGWTFWTMMALGCFGLTTLHHTIRGSWGLSVLRMWEAGGGARTLLWMGALFIPVLCFLPVLYYWADPAIMASDKILQHKAPYLNVGGFTARWAIFFLIWAAMAWGFRASAKRQEISNDVREEHRRTNYAAPGLLFFFLSTTFAWTDWAMSVDAHWFSTIWGVIFAVGAALGALSFTVMLFAANSEKAPFNQIISPALTRDLGNLLFVLTMLWGYTNISQYLIIWSGNLPEFTTYFKSRSDGGWNAIGCALIIGQFFLPFVALLTPRVKREPMLLAKIAGWLFVMRILDVFAIMIPFFRGTPALAWTDVVAFLGIGGIWFSLFAFGLKRAALLPKYDQRLQEALEHAH